VNSSGHALRNTAGQEAEGSVPPRPPAYTPAATGADHIGAAASLNNNSPACCRSGTPRGTGSTVPITAGVLVGTTYGWSRVLEQRAAQGFGSVRGGRATSV
jgi:hypothetical protein